MTITNLYNKLQEVISDRAQYIFKSESESVSPSVVSNSLQPHRL